MKVKLFNHPKQMTVSEFAETNVVLSEGNARGQKFSYNNRPYFRDPSNAMGDNRHNCRVVIMSPTQLGKTTAFLNYLYYIITYDPDNTLIILDSNKTASKLSKVRVRPFLKNQVKLESLQRGVHTDYKKSASDNNISLSSGKNILIGSARSPSDLCSFSCKYLLCDEISRYPEILDKEGDPITLAMQRQETYTRSMAVLTSTPTTADCAINQHYLLGTQNRWSAVCECGHHMPVYYKDIDFSDINNPTYTCEKCGTVYDEYTLQYKLKHEYAPDANPNPFRDNLGRVCKSYHIPGTLVPERYTWKYLREKEIASRQTGAGGYASFVNTSLGEIYHPGIEETLDVNRVLQCRKFFDKEHIPHWVDYVTCGIDTQDNRFELIVLGSDINRNHICFIERKIIPGDLKKPKVWTDLLNYLNTFKTTTRDKRTLPIQIACIDSGGHFTQDVYAFCLQSPRLRPVKGIARPSAPRDMIYKITDVHVKAFANGSGKIPLTHVNTLYAKDVIREQLLRMQANYKESTWIISSNLDANFDNIFFEQMNSEYRETFQFGKYRWTQKPGIRNEALDCTVYALTAIDIVRLITKNSPAVINNTSFKNTLVDVDNVKKDNNTDLNIDTLLKDIDINDMNISTSSNNTSEQNTLFIKRKQRIL